MNASTTHRSPAEPAAPITADALSAANINPSTWLATDYLNHFNEAIMLLDMYASDPGCLSDLLAWRPKSYREHFSSSRFRDRHIALAAYDAADPIARRDLEKISDMMSAVLQATCAAMRSEITRDDATALAGSVVSGLRPLIARAGAVINGEDAGRATPQSLVDGLMNRTA